MTERDFVPKRGAGGVLAPREPPTVRLPGAVVEATLRPPVQRPLRRAGSTAAPRRGPVSSIDDHAEAPTAVWSRMEVLESSPTRRMSLHGLHADGECTDLVGLDGRQIARTRPMTTERLPLPPEALEASDGDVELSAPRRSPVEERAEPVSSPTASMIMSQQDAPCSAKQVLITVNAVLLAALLLWLVALISG